MDLLLAPERTAVVDYGRRMLADGLVVGTSGNLSVRAGDLVAVSPSGVPYDGLTPEHVGMHRLDGEPVDARSPPTSEMAMHLAVYARGDVPAVVHTHSVAATAVATVLVDVPSMHYQVAKFGGPVRVAPYATYGTPELAAKWSAALHGRTGCLLGNHGTVTVGVAGRGVQPGALPRVALRRLLRARSVGAPRYARRRRDRAGGRTKFAAYGVRAPRPGPA